MSALVDDLFDAAACGLLITDKDGVVLKSNAAFCHALGRESTAVDGRVSFQSLLTVGGRMFHQTHWSPLMQLQGAVAEVKLDFLHQDGRKVPMVVNARVITLADGRPAHSIAAFVATDRDRYEQALLSARAEATALLHERTVLQQGASERSQFAEQLIGIVSHDLRNPLTAIRMGTELLVAVGADARQLRISERINQSVDRALSLVEDLLDFTLTKTGRPLDLTLVGMDLQQVVATGVEELRWAFPAVSLAHVHAGDGSVEGDPERLVRVLGNLVANAARYGDSTRPITVFTSINEGTASLRVHNFGTPIDPLLLPRLFEPMTRGTTAHGAGVGLGLYIVSQIARAHGGQPRVSSSAGEGTHIGIDFPVHPAR